MKNGAYQNSDFYLVQKTLKHPLFFEGVSLHSGKLCRLELQPAPANQGILFLRKDVDGGAPIPANFEYVISTNLATTLAHPSRPELRIGTVEHLMAAIYGSGITNLTVLVHGDEIPILDGSAYPFVQAIQQAGYEFQPFTAPVLKIKRPVKFYANGAICELLPRADLRLTTSIDFPHPLIGQQTFAVDMVPQTFFEEVARARTFGFLRDFEGLKRMNLAQGASLENVLAFDEKEILNAEGARYLDECVRHKLLDALGDLALCGSFIKGEFVSFRGGHSAHRELLKSLSSHPGSWELEKAEPLPPRLRKVWGEGHLPELGETDMPVIGHPTLAN